MSDNARWIQRFDNYKRAMKQLLNAVELSKKRELSLLEKQGFIQAFEFTHELAWNLLKDYFNYQGNFEIRGSRDAIREGFKVGIIRDGELWMQSISIRNKTSHIYDEEMVGQVYEIISKDFVEIFKDLKETFEKIANEQI